MALISDALDTVARETSVTPPASWVSATDAEHVEIRDDFLRQAVADILDRVDLPDPVGAQYTITGDGSEEYSLPADFLRLKRDDWSVYETGLLYPLVPVPSEGEYEYIKDRGLAGAERYFTLGGYEGARTIKIYREPTASVSILVSYQSRNWMATDGGAAGYAFTSGDDVLLLPRELIEVGCVYRWRRRRGLEYTDVYAEYEAKMSRLSVSSKARRRVSFGEQPARKPWDVPVPDFIPSS